MACCDQRGAAGRRNIPQVRMARRRARPHGRSKKITTAGCDLPVKMFRFKEKSRNVSISGSGPAPGKGWSAPGPKNN